MGNDPFDTIPHSDAVIDLILGPTSRLVLAYNHLKSFVEGSSEELPLDNLNLKILTPQLPAKSLPRDYSPSVSKDDVYQDLPQHRRKRNNFWTEQEDRVLLEAVEAAQNSNDWRGWKVIADRVGGKTSDQCSQRYHRVLRMDIKKGRWTADEDQLLLAATKEHGVGNWRLISNHFDNRTDIQCRYRFYRLRRR
ncbi:hypothetical protein GEMRC1_002388 [Eukaryota sp. GEM-RC1]